MPVVLANLWLTICPVVSKFRIDPDGLVFTLYKGKEKEFEDTLLFFINYHKHMPCEISGL